MHSAVCTLRDTTRQQQVESYELHASAGSIPTGEVRAVSGAMDLRGPVRIGRGIAHADQGVGYDHNYALRRAAGADGLRRAASKCRVISA